MTFMLLLMVLVITLFISKLTRDLASYLVLFS